MDTQTQEMFDTIVAMDKDNLTKEQLGFLMARRDYMNDALKARYASEIKLHEAGKLFVEATATAEEAPVKEKKGK